LRKWQQFLVAWRFDGELLASGGRDDKIILWDPKKGDRLKTLEGHRLAKLFFCGLPRSPGERRRVVPVKLTFEKMAAMT